MLSVTCSNIFLTYIHSSIILLAYNLLYISTMLYTLQIGLTTWNRLIYEFWYRYILIKLISIISALQISSTILCCCFLAFFLSPCYLGLYLKVIVFIFHCTDRKNNLFNYFIFEGIWFFINIVCVSYLRSSSMLNENLFRFDWPMLWALANKVFSFFIQIHYIRLALNRFRYSFLTVYAQFLKNRSESELKALKWKKKEVTIEMKG